MAADRQSRDGQLHVQHRGRIAAAGMGMAGEHGGVAGQLLVEAEAPLSQMQEGVEPLQAAQRDGQQVGAGVAAGEVGALVGDDQGRFLAPVPLLEGEGQDDARAPRAHHRRTFDAVATPVAFGVGLEPAQACDEAALLAGEAPGHGQGAQQPDGGEHAGPPGPFRRCRGRGDLLRNHQQRTGMQGHQRRRQQLPGFRPRQQCDQQCERHQRPGRIGHARTEGSTQRTPQRQHQQRGRARGQAAFHQPAQHGLSGAHRRAPPPAGAARRYRPG